MGRQRFCQVHLTSTCGLLPVSHPIINRAALYFAASDEKFCVGDGIDINLVAIDRVVTLQKNLSTRIPQQASAMLRFFAGVMELADVRDSKSFDGHIVWVRPPPPAPMREYLSR